MTDNKNYNPYDVYGISGNTKTTTSEDFKRLWPGFKQAIDKYFNPLSNAWEEDLPDYIPPSEPGERPSVPLIEEGYAAPQDVVVPKPEMEDYPILPDTKSNTEQRAELGSALDTYADIVLRDAESMQAMEPVRNNVLDAETIMDSIREEREAQPKHQEAFAGITYNQLGTMLAAIASSIKPDNRLASVLAQQGMQEEEKLSPGYIRQEALQERQMNLAEQEGLLKTREQTRKEFATLSDIEIENLQKELALKDIEFYDEKTQADILYKAALTQQANVVSKETQRKWVQDLAPLSDDELNKVYRSWDRIVKASTGSLSPDQFIYNNEGDIVTYSNLEPKQATQTFNSLFRTYNSMPLQYTPAQQQAMNSFLGTSVEQLSNYILNTNETQLRPGTNARPNYAYDVLAGLMAGDKNNSVPIPKNAILEINQPSSKRADDRLVNVSIYQPGNKKAWKTVPLNKSLVEQGLHLSMVYPHLYQERLELLDESNETFKAKSKEEEAND